MHNSIIQIGLKFPKTLPCITVHMIKSTLALCWTSPLNGRGTQTLNPRQVWCLASPAESQEMLRLLWAAKHERNSAAKSFLRLTGAHRMVLHWLWMDSSTHLPISLLSCVFYMCVCWVTDGWGHWVVWLPRKRSLAIAWSSPGVSVAFWLI